MAYPTAPTVQAVVPGIATSEAGAMGFCTTPCNANAAQVFDVLGSQARSALLSDAVISTILNQLTVAVTYAPLMCPNVRLSVMDVNPLAMMSTACIIIDNTVTAILHHYGQAVACQLPLQPNAMVTITPVSGAPVRISGSISTANIIMASWSRTMWQSVVNRAIRTLAMGLFGSHFFVATGTIDGN